MKQVLGELDTKHIRKIHKNEESIISNIKNDSNSKIL